MATSGTEKQARLTINHCVPEGFEFSLSSHGFQYQGPHRVEAGVGGGGVLNDIMMMS